MNRTLRLLTALAFLIISLVPAAALAQEEEPGLLIWADGNRTEVMLELADQFAAEFGVTVEVQEMGLGDIRDQLQVAGPAGEGPDIIVTVHDTLGQLVANGMLLPIELSGMEEEFLPSAVDAFTLDGVVYGVPYATENMAFVRNPDILPEPIETWQEIADLSAEMNGEEVKYVWLLVTGNVYETFPLITAFGGYIFGFDGESYDVTDIGFASPGGIDAAEYIDMMAEEGYIVPDVNSDVLFELYTSGELATFMTGPWFLERLRDTGQPYVLERFPGSTTEYGIEHGRPFSGVQGFSISAFTEDPLLAETFVLDYIATEETMQALFEAEPRPSAWLSVREAIDDPDLSAFAEAGAEAMPMPNIPEMSAVWSAGADALNLIVQGQVDGEEAFMTAAEQISNTIAQSQALAESGEIVVNIPGSFQAALGCPGDWQPECETTLLTLNEETGMYEGTFEIPAGEYMFKIAHNLTWDENYGQEGERDGADIPLNLEEDSTVTFTYDPETHIVTTTIEE